MPTLIYCTGFEYGLTAPVNLGGGLCNAIGGTPVIQNTVKRTGSYALQIDATAATEYFRVSVAGSPTCLVGRFYFNYHSISTTGTRVFPAETAGGLVWNFKFVTATAKLQANISGSGAQLSGALSADTWYRIDFRFDCSGTTGTLDWQVDGVDQTQSTKTSMTPSAFIRFGLGEDTNVTTCTMYYDDVAISITSGDYPIGAGAVIGLRPNADGTHNNAANIMEDSAGNDIDGSTYFAFDKLDEDPWITTRDADYVRQTATGAANYCEINFADTAQTTINGVRAILQWSGSGYAANNGSTYILDSDAQSTTVYSGDMSEPTAAFYSSIQVAAPAGGWTPAYVNSLKCRFGYSTDSTTDPYWLAIILEVDGVTVAPSAWTPKVIMVM